MRAYSNMPLYEFTSQLRAIAQRANARPAVFDMLDQIEIRLTDDEIEKQCEDARDEGNTEGRGVQWEMCFDALATALRDDGVGDLTAAQCADVLQILIDIKPEWLK